MPENGTLIQLAPTVGLHLRRNGALQFGVDSAWAGVIDTLTPETTRRVHSLLTDTRSPVTDGELTEALVEAGVAPAETATLIDELLGYGVLVPVRGVTHRIGVLGENPLADGVRDLLVEHGVEVSGRLPGERPGGFLRTFAPGSPVVVTGAPDELPGLALPILQRGGDVIPVTVVDGRVVLGPLRLRGEGPCPLCLRLHQCDTDPDGPRDTFRFGDGGWLPPDPVVLHTAVTSTAALVLRCAGVTAPAPGPDRGFLSVGTVLTVDPHRLTTGSVRYGTHPHCPECWSAAHR